ncbi:AP-4 complex subunit mu-like [Canna indica]|uniref:AP-4 complex subunit mu-like n=1 Tax=Canna indica TaxID=4628 RepID=A0AAQ3L0G3_9LILI|nr:AP-4 complex subunit mu-like [Canna indica]
MISQFFVLSQRGDNIVFRDYRGEVPKGSAEIFFRKVKFWKEDEEEEAPPVFNADGVNYIHVKVAGLFFVATTRVNVSPSLVLELLQRIARVTKDYLGVLNEDSLRKNFVLVYELLDEVIDFGYPQTTSTEVLKSYVFNEPIVVDAAHMPPLGPASMFMQGTKRMPGTAVTKSVVATEAGGRKREEIFVDIIEKISVTFSSSGYILTSEIDGTIQMKSYLTGNPEIRLALNEELSIGRGGGSVYDYRSSAGGGAVILDDCNFHESVRLDSFDVDRTLTLIPPDGEFAVMNYRMTQEFKPPFRVNALIEEAGQLKAEVIIKVRADFSASVTANTITVQMPVPTYTARVSFELESGAVGQTTDFKEGAKRLEWSLKKIVGGAEHTLRAKLTFSQESHGNLTREAGPVNMNFTIPMYNASKLQVRYLQIAKKSPSYNPYRWLEIFNPMDYAAEGDGVTDDSLPLEDAWDSACEHHAPAIFLIPAKTIFLAGPVTFAGPCRVTPQVQIRGILKAVKSMNSFRNPGWIEFKHLNGLHISGGGILDGQGAASWNIQPTKTKNRPLSLRFLKVSNTTVHNLTLINSKGFHINIQQSSSVRINSLHIWAPADSPNTDGIHISRSDNVRITSTKIGTGDDCISIGEGSTNVLIQGVSCGPGHGIR